MAATTISAQRESDEVSDESRSGTRLLPRQSGAAPGPDKPWRCKAVVVHSGARDAYQVALALEERGELAALVTDLFWTPNRPWASWLLHLLPGSVTALLKQRSAALPASRVRLLAGRGLATLILDKVGLVPFRWKRQTMRATDAALGRHAGKLAKRTGATLVSYSYYGYHAFAETRAPGILFQLHPHPGSMRRILEAELRQHPECAGSLQKEWELALPEEDFLRLVAETKMAAHILVASSFTRATLVEHGIPAASITVIPYGVDCRRFLPGAERSCPVGSENVLRLLFVGRINQRKGIKYLLESLRLLAPAGDRLPKVELTVCGRIVDGLELFAPFADQVKVRPDVSVSDLIEAYQTADLFVFPSLGEGFGQVLLEALACGLPILSTTRTAAPDLVVEGIEGFVVEPGRPDLLAARIEWARRNPEALAAMRLAARRRAEHFSWERFRAGVASAVENFAAEAPASRLGSERLESEVRCV